MPDVLKLSDFDGHLRSKFPTGLETGGAVDLELVEAAALPPLSGPAPAGVRRDPFSLIFHGPINRPLPQRIYELEHPSRGTLQIFLVPIGPTADGTAHRYQAIFN
jgi:hypothetical protein